MKNAPEDLLTKDAQAGMNAKVNGLSLVIMRRSTKMEIAESIQKTLFQCWEFTIWLHAKHKKEFTSFRKEFEKDIKEMSECV